MRRIGEAAPPSAEGPGAVGLDELPDAAAARLVQTLSLDEVCRLGQTNRYWRRQSAARAELDRGRLLPLLRAQQVAAAARLASDARLRLRVDLDETDPFGMTPLMHAAAAGHTGVVKSLLRDGASAQARDKCGLSAKAWASLRGHPKTASTFDFIDDELLPAPPSPLSAARAGHLPLVLAGVEAGADINRADGDGWLPVHHLARYALPPEEAIAAAAAIGAHLGAVHRPSGTTVAHLLARYAARPERGLQVLAAHGVALDVIDHEGWSPQLLLTNQALNPAPALQVIAAATRAQAAAAAAVLPRQPPPHEQRQAPASGGPRPGS